MPSSLDHIIYWVYGRRGRAGDSLASAFRYSNINGFDSAHDVGNPGPGDAMSEFRGYMHHGTGNDTDPPAVSSNTWDNLTAYKRSWVDPINPQLSGYFGSGIGGGNPFIEFTVEWKSANAQLAVWPIRSKLKLDPAEYFIQSALPLESVDDSHIHEITSTKYVLENGVYSVAASATNEIIVTGVDAANKESLAEIKPGGYPYLHILNKGTYKYGWKWSNEALIIPELTWAEQYPQSGADAPGQEMPVLIMKIESSPTYQKMFVVVDLIEIDTPVTIVPSVASLDITDKNADQNDSFAVVFEQGRMAYAAAQGMLKDRMTLRCVPRIFYDDGATQEQTVATYQDRVSPTKPEMKLYIVFQYQNDVDYVVTWQWVDVVPAPIS